MTSPPTDRPTPTIEDETELRKCRHGGIWEPYGEGAAKCSKCGDVDILADPDDYPTNTKDDSMTDPTTPAPELTALEDDGLLSDFAVAAHRRLNLSDPDRARYYQDQYTSSKHELLRRLAAAERPAEGDTVAISRGELTLILTAVAHAPYESRKDAEAIIMRAINDIAAASSAPAAAALGQGEYNPDPAEIVTVSAWTARHARKALAHLIETSEPEFDCGDEKGALAELDAALGQGEGTE